MSDNSFEERFNKLEARVSKIEKIILKKESIPMISNIEKLIIGKVENTPIHHLIVIVLKLKPKQTRQEIKKALEDLGKVVGKWFTGGNMNNRLIKMSIVKKDGVNEKNEDLFVLTKKGEILADDLITKLQC